MFFEQSKTSLLVVLIVSDVSCAVITLSWVINKSMPSLEERYLRQPCTIPFVNIWRSLPFILGGLIGIATFIPGGDYIVIVGAVISVGLFLVWTIGYWKHQKRTFSSGDSELTKIDLSVM
jgi:hypothetical protein